MANKKFRAMNVAVPSGQGEFKLSTLVVPNTQKPSFLSGIGIMEKIAFVISFCIAIVGVYLIHSALSPILAMTWQNDLNRLTLQFGVYFSFFIVMIIIPYLVLTKRRE